MYSRVFRFSHVRNDGQNHSDRGSSSYGPVPRKILLTDSLPFGSCLSLNDYTGKVCLIVDVILGLLAKALLKENGPEKHDATNFEYLLELSEFLYAVDHQRKLLIFSGFELLPSAGISLLNTSWPYSQLAPRSAISPFNCPSITTTTFRWTGGRRSVCRKQTKGVKVSALNTDRRMLPACYPSHQPVFFRQHRVTTTIE